MRRQLWGAVVVLVVAGGLAATLDRENSSRSVQRPGAHRSVKVEPVATLDGVDALQPRTAVGPPRGARSGTSQPQASTAATQAAIPGPNAWTTEQTYIRSGDGTALRTSVFKPAKLVAGDRVAVILKVTPYGGSGGDAFDPTPLNQAGPEPAELARSGRIFEKGYAYVEVHLRGTGGSGGCYDYGGPGEQADAKAAVEWAAAQPWSTGKVGMIGSSQDGQSQLMALATRPAGLAAVIPVAPPQGYTSNFVNGVNLVTGRGFPVFYVANDLVPPSLFAPSEEMTTALAGSLSRPTCYVAPTLGGLTGDPNAPYWRERDLAAKLVGTRVPTLWVHGFGDYNVRPITGLVAFKGIVGFKRAILGPWDHLIPGGTPGMWTGMQMAWMDAFLKDDPIARATVEAWPAVQVQDRDSSWRGEASWPPADATALTMPLHAGSYLDGPGNNGEPGVPPYFEAFAGVDMPAVLPTGIGTWTFSRPLATEAHLAGLPRLTVDARTLLPGATLVAHLYDVDAGGRATLILRGASKLNKLGRQIVSFSLSPQDWRIPAGHRIGLLLSGGDTVWLEPGKTLLPVRVLGGNVSIPIVAGRVSATLPGPFAPTTFPGPFTVPATKISAGTVPAP